MKRLITIFLIFVSVVCNAQGIASVLAYNTAHAVDSVLNASGYKDGNHSFARGSDYCFRSKKYNGKRNMPRITMLTTNSILESIDIAFSGALIKKYRKVLDGFKVAGMNLVDTKMNEDNRYKIEIYKSPLYPKVSVFVRHPLSPRKISDTSYIITIFWQNDIKSISF